MRLSANVVVVQNWQRQANTTWFSAAVWSSLRCYCPKSCLLPSPGWKLGGRKMLLLNQSQQARMWEASSFAPGQGQSFEACRWWLALRWLILHCTAPCPAWLPAAGVLTPSWATGLSLWPPSRQHVCPYLSVSTAWCKGTGSAMNPNWQSRQGSFLQRLTPQKALC